MKKHVMITGTGMDGNRTLTCEAKQAIEKADLLIGAARMLKPFEHCGKPMINCYESRRIAGHIAESSYSNIAVLVSGDCGFYSAAGSLLPLLGEYETELVCGISTPVYFCSRVGLQWSDMRFVSLHGANAPIVRNVCSHRYTFFLLGGSAEPSIICRRLCEYSREDVQVYIGENLASENERISKGAARDFIDFKADKLCALIVVNDNYERYIPSCIDDDQFIRGGVPMTKAEVRGLCVAKLHIGENDVCWDIGCGTGSVSVEMAFRCRMGRVLAVDKSEEAISLTRQNMLQFGCDNIELICGSAEDVVEDLPAPDCVFIGGSGGSLESIIKNAATKNPDVKTVITAVSLETLNKCSEVFADCGFESEITQVAVTRTRRVGSHTMLAAENPIFIIKRKMS